MVCVLHLIAFLGVALPCLVILPLVLISLVYRHLVEEGRREKDLGKEGST